MFFKPFENTEVIIIDMFLQDLKLLLIHQPGFIDININISFHTHKNHFNVVLLLMDLASVVMNLDCKMN